MTTQSMHSPPGARNARNLLTVLEVAEWTDVYRKPLTIALGHLYLSRCRFQQVNSGVGKMSFLTQNDLL